MVFILLSQTAVLSIYAIIGSTLICCLETQLKFLRVMIAVNFGFLFSSTWRFMYYLLLASISFSFKGLGGKIVGSAFVAVAFYNTYVLCRYPTYRKIREKIAEEEDKVSAVCLCVAVLCVSCCMIERQRICSVTHSVVFFFLSLVQRIEARISKEVKKQMVGQAMK